MIGKRLRKFFSSRITSVVIKPCGCCLRCLSHIFNRRTFPALDTVNLKSCLCTLFLTAYCTVSHHKLTYVGWYSQNIFIWTRWCNCEHYTSMCSPRTVYSRVHGMSHHVQLMRVHTTLSTLFSMIHIDSTIYSITLMVLLCISCSASVPGLARRGRWETQIWWSTSTPCSAA